MILEIQRHHLSVGWNGVDTLLAPGAEQLQGRAIVHFRIVKFGRWRGIHHIATVNFDRVRIAGGDLAMTADVLVELHMHQPIFLQGVHAARFGLARLEKTQGLRDRHLEHEDLAFMKGRLGNAVAGLDHGRFDRCRRCAHACGLHEKLSDRHRVDGVVGTLVDHLEDVVWAKDRGCDLHAPGAPTVWHRHLAARERHLIARDRDRLENGAADHPLGLLVEIREIVDWRVHSAASCSGAAAAKNSSRMRRISPSSAWKSTWCGSFRCSTKPVACTLSEWESTNSSSWAGALISSPSSRARSARSTSAMLIALRSQWPKPSP